MKSRYILGAALAVLLTSFGAVSCSDDEKVEASVPAVMEDGKIVLETPEREAGQASALLMKCDPIDTVRVGFVGIGSRGSEAVSRYTYIDGVKITALCDRRQEAIDSCQKTLSRRNLPAAKEYCGEEAWKQLCESPDVDLVYVCTPWLLHTPIAVYAMEHGKHVAIEVPAAMSIKECWDLVNTSEKTRKHCMMLENCVYDFFETTTLAMARKGMFGDITHVAGGYIHNLDPFWNGYDRNWRLDYDQKHRGDNYPTHGIGPLCQVLNIHRGDKMEYVVSMDSDAYHGKAVAKAKMGVDDFAEGDHTVSLIRTHNGKIIEIQHNVYAQRPYSRIYEITGTKGYAVKYPDEHYAFQMDNGGDSTAPKAYDDLTGEEFIPQDLQEEMMEEFKLPFVKEIEEKAKEVGGHGGMDYIMDYRLIYCLRNGLPLDEDVYDAAEWSCLTELSGLSIKYGSVPVEVPDFTRGDWDKIKGYTHAMAE
jgi:predicted dehydrogenase